MRPKSPHPTQSSTGTITVTTSVRPHGKPRPDVSHFDQLPDAALIAIRALAVVMGGGVSTAWRKCKNDPDFPKPIRLSPGCTRFNVGDIRTYLAKKAEASLKPKRVLGSKGQVKV